ncbi:MAG: polysaccharide biosynthesis/export family protein [Cyanobacteria bacterium P01_A01_bin.84]
MLNTGLLKILTQSITSFALLIFIGTAFESASLAQQKVPASPKLLAQAGANFATSNYTLGGGDRIRVKVLEVEEYSGEYQIPPGGGIDLPLIGSVSVKGLTTTQAADLIANKYRRFLKRPIISVNLLSPRPINVLVAGEVTRPGGYTLSLQGGAGNDPGVQYPTVLAALTTAQGVTMSADVTEVKLRRQIGLQRREITVNLKNLIERGSTGQDLTLRDGDVIYVPTATRFDVATARNLAAANFAADPTKPRTVAVIGEVTRPGSYLVTPGANGGDNNNPTGAPAVTGQPTVMRALQLAGGITPQANIRDVKVRRLTRVGNEQIIDVNLWQILQSGDISQDIILQDGDTIVFPTATEINPAEATQLATTTLAPSRIQVSVVGEVKKPGETQLRPNSPLNQAILSAGGFNNARAKRKSVELVRINPNGTVTKRKIKVDLTAGINEKSNPILRNNDVVLVGRSTLARTADPVGVVAGPLGTILNVVRFIFGGF